MLTVSSLAFPACGTFFCLLATNSVWIIKCNVNGYVFLIHFLLLFYLLDNVFFITYSLTLINFLPLNGSVALLAVK